MASNNENVAQGLLNRVAANVIFNQGTLFAISPYYLGREGIRLTLEGNATDYFPTMTGAVPSPAPFQIATLTIALLKSQPQSQQIKQRFEFSTLLGDCTIYPDVNLDGDHVLNNYVLHNCVLESVNAMSFAGEEPTWVVTIKGYYEVNSDMFSGVPNV
jgi:hypothetical protein